MKKRKLLLSSGVVGAFLLGFLLRGVMAPQQQGGLAAPPPQSATAQEPSAAAGSVWSREAVYVGGDQVQYGGKLYRAKWWTQGETPGSAEVWEDTGSSAVPPVSTPTPEPPDPPAAQTGTAQSGSKVVGYYPSWKPGETGKLRWDVLTHVVYAFAIPTAEGGLRPLENEQTAREIIQTGHARGVSVLLAVGGWSYQDTPLEATFVEATATAEKREAFANALVALCGQYGFDGIDMDWEHPRVDGASGKQYEALMLLLADKLHAQGKVLTSAVLSGATADGNVYYDAAAHSDRVLAAVDWIHVMAYDGGDGERHSSYAFAQACGAYWTGTRGLPAEKVVLGVPFYGRPGWASYEEILRADPNAWNKDHTTVSGVDAHYNGVETMTRKAQYAREQLGGIMIWEVTQDTKNQAHSLTTAIAKGLGR